MKKIRAIVPTKIGVGNVYIAQISRIDDGVPTGRWICTTNKPCAKWSTIIRGAF